MVTGMVPTAMPPIDPRMLTPASIVPACAVAFPAVGADAGGNTFGLDCSLPLQDGYTNAESFFLVSNLLKRSGTPRNLSDTDKRTPGKQYKRRLVVTR